MAMSTYFRLNASNPARLLVVSIALSILVAGPAGCATARPNAKTGYTAGESWESIRARLATPELIDEYLNSCPIVYEGEKPRTLNHTQSPEETIRTLRGDCEDYAFLITDALRFHGYEAGIISVEAKIPGGLLIHAVAIYRDPDTGRWHYIHGYRFKGLSIGVSEGFDSQVELARDIAGHMKGRLYQYFVMSPDGFRKVYDTMLN
jgi:hypothetical protein